MKVILISGKAQHGKDTVASMIKDKLVSDNHKVLVTHYADLLKFICRNYFGWDGQKDEKGRQLLQYVGTDIVRKKVPSLWVDFIVMMLKIFNGSWDYVIIPDCRFPNEVEGISNARFNTVHLRVTRPEYTSGLTSEQQSHPSETMLDNIKPDFYIENKGTLGDLETIISTWVKENIYEK